LKFENKRMFGQIYKIVLNDAHTVGLILNKYFVPPPGYVDAVQPLFEINIFNDKGDEIESFININGTILSKNLFPDDGHLISKVLIKPQVGNEISPVFYLTEEGWHCVAPVEGKDFYFGVEAWTRS